MKRVAYWTCGLLLCIGLFFMRPITQKAYLSTTSSSPSSSFMLVSLGGLRGILSEVLWWRINDLQRQGRNAEVYPLTQLLTELDPATTNVAVFNAWNCAYNIATSYDNPDTRWIWMKRGYTILSEALISHPNDENALREMVAFWQLKFYGNIDPYQNIFQMRVAEIPMERRVRDILRQQGLPENPHLAALRLYAWAHHAGFNRDERFAIMRLLEAFPTSPAPHQAFAEAYLVGCREQWMNASEAKPYQAIAAQRLQRFPNDPYLLSILKETP
jgi:hypothetical protein